MQPGRHRLAPGGAGRSPRVRVRDTASGRQLPEVRHGQTVTAAASSPGRHRPAAGSGGKAVRIWSAAGSQRAARGRGIRSGLIRRPSRRCGRADRHGQVPGVLRDRAPAEPAQRARIPLAEGAAELVSRHDLPGPGAVRRPEQVRGGSAPGTLLSPGGPAVLPANLQRNPSGTARICRCERVLSAHSYAVVSIYIRDQHCSERYVLSTGIHLLRGPDLRRRGR